MVALIASTGAVQAQSLPGPAAGGWYVAIGENPFHVWKRSHPDRKIFYGTVDFNPPVCTAKVIRATDQLVITGEDPFEWMGDGKTGVDFAAEPKRFGPFPNEYAAEASLKNSGWSGSLTANVGCDLAQPAPRPANALGPCPREKTCLLPP
jgi:hypothetical protein